MANDGSRYYFIDSEILVIAFVLLYSPIYITLYENLVKSVYKNGFLLILAKS
jgi:hypothetical protein